MRLCTSIALLAASTTALLDSVRALAPQGSGFTAQVRFSNDTPIRRKQWGLATVPFPQGEWTSGRSYGVRNQSGELVPFGARWPDGSVRFAQLALLVDLPAFQEQVFQVESLTTNPAPFAYSPWVQSRLANFNCDVQVSVGGVIRSASLRQLAVVEDTPVRKTTHYRDRIPGTQLVYDLWLTFFTGQDLAQFELRVTSQMVGGQAWTDDIDWMVFMPRGAAPIVRGRFRENLFQPTFDPSSSNPVVLLGPTSFFDGQAYEWFGDLVFWNGNVQPTDAALRRETIASSLFAPLYGIALNWRSSGAFGPFGYLPQPPAWLTDNGREAAIRHWQSFQTWSSTSGRIWEDRPMGLLPYAASTGTQHDFGVHKLVEVFASGMPQGIEEARYMAGEESHRPVHYREADGSPLRAANHPNFVTRAGRVHWNSSVSPDRLGKPQPEVTPTGRANGWTGKDEEHWSSLTLASSYLLTRSWSLLAELDNEAELYLTSQTVPSLHGSQPTNGIDNGRAVGRSMLSMSWNWLCTGRADLVDRMRRRVDECVIPQHYGMRVGGVVQPLSVKGPDPRSIGSGENWSPWEEGIAVSGLGAFAQISNHPNASMIAWEIGRNLVMHGWKVDFDETLVGYALRYMPGGAPLPPGANNSTEYARWPSSPEAFNIWCLPATRLTLLWAQQRGDTATAQRALWIEAATEALRRPARSGPLDWDQFAGWDLL